MPAKPDTGRRLNEYQVHAVGQSARYVHFAADAGRYVNREKLDD